MDNKIYHECMQLTSQFKFCPNAFRVDMYRGCDFGCKYCFANMEAFKECGTGLTIWRDADIRAVTKKFELALDTDRPSKSTIIELLRHKVPMHCGGMSDPFQKREFTNGLTKELIKLSNKYNYPICFSTKAAHLPDEYLELLQPNLHTFQISLMGIDNDYVSKWESNTPPPIERVEFIKLLKNKGFWCGVRIQPVIEVDECEKLIHYLGDLPDYYSIEHLHIIADSHLGIDTLLQHCHNPNDFTQVGGVTEFKYLTKLENLTRLTKVANSYGVKVGAADNDLHHLSQSRCCCGLDLMGSEFENYLKFNTTYLGTGKSDISKMFIPKTNIRRHMNVGKGIPEVYVKDVVTKYIKDNRNLIPREYRDSVEKQLFGSVKKPLF